MYLWPREDFLDYFKVPRTSATLHAIHDDIADEIVHLHTYLARPTPRLYMLAFSLPKKIQKAHGWTDRPQHTTPGLTIC